jgi:hypothetical protein
VVVPGRNPSFVREAVVAITENRHAGDELHVLTLAETTNAFRVALIRQRSTTALSRWFTQPPASQDVIGGTGMIHTVGRGPRAMNPGVVADDLLRILHAFCEDRGNDVTIVVAPDSGLLGLLIGPAFQIAGKPTDRMFVLEPGRRGRTGGTRGRRTPSLSGPALVELPTVLAERPIPAAITYQEIAKSRRLARQRLIEPGMLVMNASQRTVTAGDTVIVLPRLQFFWMYCFAMLAPTAFPLRELSANITVGRDGKISVACTHRRHLETIVEDVRKAFVSLFPEAAHEFPLMFNRACGPAPGLPSVVAKLNSALRSALEMGAEPYLIVGGRRSGGYRLTLPPTQIELRPPADLQAAGQN